MSSEGQGRSPLTLFALLFSIVLYGILVVRFAWLCDDAFISFRYAENWAEGSGLRFNAWDQPPVEGYSNFLWVAMGALVELLGGEQTRVMPWLSAAAGIAVLVTLAWALRRGLSLSDRTSAFSLVTLAGSVPFATWATGGLETMAFTACFFLVFTLMTLWPQGIPVLAAGLLGLALALLRVEGAFWAAGLGLLGWFVRRSRGERAGSEVVGTLFIIAAGAWAWWIARYLYYGDPWPNTVHVKVGFSAATLATGGRYLATFALTWLTPALLLLAVPLGLAGRHRRTTLAALGCWAGIWAYAALVGGDFMAMGRMLVPSLPFQALLFGIGLDEISRRRSLALVPLVLTVIHLGLGLAGGLGVDLVPRSTLEPLHFRGNAEVFRTELEQWDYMRENSVERRVLAELLEETTQEGETLVRGAIGVVGYYTDLVILDTFGLVSTEVSRREEVAEDRSPGHAKKVEPMFFLPMKPDYMVARTFDLTDVEEGEDVSRRITRLARRWRREFEGTPYAPVLTRHGEERVLVRVARVAPDSVDETWKAFDGEVRRLP